jgi:nitrate reductase gamma subunit
VRREVILATLTGAGATAVLAALIVVGSRRLAHFDAALVGYTFATLFAVFGIAYRYTIWLQRPPTWLYWKRGWQLFLRPGDLLSNLLLWFRRLFNAFVVNRFIWRRSATRGVAHWLIMWGCLLAAAITFPLVFGWIHFALREGDFTHYDVVVFGFELFPFTIESIWGDLIFHGLVWASFLVIAGVMLAMRRRMRDRDAAALQSFAEDVLPLVLLFAISITGLMLVVSYEWMQGYAYEFLSILHAAVVIVTLVYLPFGKFFHIFQRPAQLGVSFYKDVGGRGPQAHCARCRQPYASQMHVDDLIEVERKLGYKYDLPGAIGHYQRICPRCRRLLPALLQGRLWRVAAGNEGEPQTDSSC